jgi:hypothetical protein
MAPCTALALEGEPLRIESFKLQTIARTVEQPLGGRSYQFVNVPYSPAFTQAGGHPWALTASGEFGVETNRLGVHAVTRDVKDIVTALPTGLLGDPQAMPACSLTQVTSEAQNSFEECPADTQVGWYRLEDLGEKELLAPIVNVKPEKGQSAEFALENTTKILTPILTAHLVRTSEGYGFAVVSKEIPIVNLQRFELTFWGVPADPSHDAMRGRICRKVRPTGPLECEGGGEKVGVAAVPFLTMPTDCTAGPEAATIRADSWQEPGSVGTNGSYTGYVEASTPFPAAEMGVTGCNLLQFNPGTGVGLQPDTELADEPVGLGVRLSVPLNEAPATNASPLLRDTTVTLPEGMSVSPGVVDGIHACDATGPEGINVTGPESEQVGLDGELHLAPGHCPDASIVGTAEAVTPFLPAPVKGHVYLARPGCGGAGQAACTEQDALDGNLYRLYLELGGVGELADTGIEFKVPLSTEANPATGQLTTVARELVQAPYSEVTIHLNGGPRAPIDNPATCGPAVTTSDFTPWSAPGSTPAGALVAGTPDLTSLSYFDVIGCASPPPFKPGFVAGTVTPNAGKFSSFTLALSRQDREQYVKGIQVHVPPGLSGMLSNVQLCGETQADQGTCPESSKIGTTRVATGAGSHPFEIEGDIYLTGPYDGDGASCTVGSPGCAPFGLSIAVHIDVGPFHLGVKVVRARIAVNPDDSTLTVTTDETGPYAVPQIVFGVPVRLQRVTVNVDRPGFMFNPTSCNAMAIQAAISGSQQAVANVSSPFAVGGCRDLAFKPAFKVSTSGHTSRASGASLDVKLSYPADAMGSDANIAKVKVELPKQLPSRLTTLQRACPATTFESNPATCPAGSIVGVARSTTPLLPVRLEGPVYFVSHGGEAFPSLIIVLQGDNVRVDLRGATFINEKTNITSSTFDAIPDVPVSTFELYLPQGRNSALAANGNLCAAAGGTRVVRQSVVTRRVHGRAVRKTVTRRSKSTGFVMPSEFVAQNGLVFKQSTRIAVDGCGTKAERVPRTRTARTRRGGQGR